MRFSRPSTIKPYIRFSAPSSSFEPPPTCIGWTRRARRLSTSAHFRPTPPSRAPARDTRQKVQPHRQQATNMRDYLQPFTSANAAVSKLEEIRATLAYSGDAETVESGL
jgi:hypothetical protein